MDLNAVLKERNMTKYTLAKTTGLGAATISELFSGKRKKVRLDTALKIAEALSIEVTDVDEYVRRR